jgi:hypothetical protein
VRAVRARCADADGETEQRRELNFMYSACGAAPGESVGRSALPSRQPPTRAARTCAKRDTPGYSCNSEGAKWGEKSAETESAVHAGSEWAESRGERPGAAAGERARGKQSAESRANPARGSSGVDRRSR